MNPEWVCKFFIHIHVSQIPFKYSIYIFVRLRPHIFTSFFLILLKHGKHIHEETKNFFFYIICLLCMMENNNSAQITDQVYCNVMFLKRLYWRCRRPHTEFFQKISWCCIVKPILSYIFIIKEGKTLQIWNTEYF